MKYALTDGERSVSGPDVYQLIERLRVMKERDEAQALAKQREETIDKLLKEQKADVRAEAFVDEILFMLGAQEDSMRDFKAKKSAITNLLTAQAAQIAIASFIANQLTVFGYNFKEIGLPEANQAYLQLQVHHTGEEPLNHTSILLKR